VALTPRGARCPHCAPHAARWQAHLHRGTAISPAVATAVPASAARAVVAAPDAISKKCEKPVSTEGFHRDFRLYQISDFQGPRASPSGESRAVRQRRAETLLGAGRMGRGCAAGGWMRLVLVAVWVAGAVQALMGAAPARRPAGGRALFVEQAGGHLLSRSNSRESVLCPEDPHGPWRRKDGAARVPADPTAPSARRPSTLLFVEHDRAPVDLTAALALPEDPHGVCRFKDSVSQRRRHLQGFNDEYWDETTVSYIHFVMDTLEREKHLLLTRPDGANTFLLSRRAWMNLQQPPASPPSASPRRSATL